MNPGRKKTGLARLLLAATLSLTPMHAQAEPIVTQETAEAAGLFSGEDVRGVMSFNLRLEGDDGDRAWQLRRPLVARIINEYRPLFIGTQEGKHSQLESLKKELPGYDYLGVSRRGNTEDEYCALFYDTQKVDVISQGNFWLSDTPEVAGSKLPASGHPRMVTWGEFRVKGSDKSTYVFNTHTAEQAVLSGAQTRILLEQVKGMGLEDAEIVITGDFNVSRSEEAIRPFTDAGFADAIQLADHTGGPDYSFHDWRGMDASSAREAREKAGKLYDWIFYRNGRTKPQEPLLINVITDHDGKVYPSDHYPVVLTTLGRAKATVDDLNVSASSVFPDQQVDVKATLRNTGKRGIVPAELRVDGQTSTAEWKALDSKEEMPIAFRTRFYEAGGHQVTVNNAPSETVNVARTPANLRYTDLSVPTYAQPGDELSIEASLRNAGSAEGESTVEVQLDGKTIAKQKITVPAGEIRDVTFAHRFDEAGAYRIRVGDREAEISVAEKLDKGWHFAKGDDPARAHAEYDASGWEDVKVPAPWEQHSSYTEDHVYGWYRNRVFIPKEWEGRPLRVLLGLVDDVDESFFNGVKVGQSGRFPDDKDGYRSAATDVRSYTIPPQHVRYGEYNSLAIRVFDSLGDGGITRGPLGILPLQAKEKGKWAEKLDQKTSQSPAKQR